MLRILIVGLGSIGRRHLKGLSELDDIETAALRSTKGTLVEAAGCPEFTTVQQALDFKPSGVIIANPTSLHVDAALPFLKSGIPVLIEKPVSAKSQDGEVLTPYAHLVRVAYCLRFHPLYLTLDTVIASEKIFKVGFKRSFYLPKWHPYADYRKEYTARKEFGGGVVRTLSHEIDLMVKWFGHPASITGAIDKVSDLQIDTDDYAFFTCGFKEGFRVNFELDFLSPVNVNSGEAFTERGKYQWDLTQLSFTPYTDLSAASSTAFTPDSIDKMYKDQLHDFLRFVSSGESGNATLNDSISVLKVIESLDG